MALIIHIKLWWIRLLFIIELMCSYGINKVKRTGRRQTTLNELIKLIDD